MRIAVLADLHGNIRADAQLADVHRAWLRAQPVTRVIDSAILLSHGMPSSDTSNLLDDVDAIGVHRAEVPAIRSRLAGVHSCVPSPARR